MAGSLLSARPIGLPDLKDEKGPGEKVLAVPVGDPRFADIRSLDELPKHWRIEIQTFFDTYKALEDGKAAIVKGWRRVANAWRAIAAACGAYRTSRRSSQRSLDSSS